MPGIGNLLGAEFIAATGGDVNAFGSADRLAGAAGLAPVPRDSGKIGGNLRRPGATAGACCECANSRPRPLPFTAPSPGPSTSGSARRESPTSRQSLHSSGVASTCSGLSYAATALSRQPPSA
ncbi:transposase [Kitasatospora sp. NPDC048239]|uniref:transposase n=1 Tax=Kitasatospora sp. NPDC048239 TaxID=3364046 RepID=UPI003722054D